MNIPNIKALVPIRHASERVVGKNYRDFNGKPLYCWIIDTLASCSYISDIFIDTNSPPVKEGAPKLSSKVHIIDRPSYLEASTIPMNEILLYDLEIVQSDHFLQTHTTNPLLSVSTLDKAIKQYFDNLHSYDSLFSVTKLQSRFWKEGAVPVNHNPDVLERTQDIPPLFEENSCIYLFSRDVIMRKRNRIGFKPQMFAMSKIESVDIDDEQDFKIAESLHRHIVGDKK